MTLKLAIAGSTGRMGKELLAAAALMGCEVSVKGNRHTAPETLATGADAVIDFTAPAYTAALAKIASAHGTALVIGTTGLSATEQCTVEEAARHIPIVQSANFSLGIAVLEALAEEAARLLDDAYDIEVDEMHHRMKKDAPSGTALLLGKAAARGRGIDFAYATHQGGERKRGEIGMSVKRGGEVAGVHTVTFAGPGENLELTHRALNRGVFAQGAIRAALWAQGKEPGLYSLKDVLAG